MALTHVFSTIAGVDAPNPVGTPRESLLGQGRPGQRLRLIREAGPPFDDGAVAVCLQNGAPLGSVTQRASERVSRWLDEGAHVDVFVTRLTGGGSVESVGCMLLIVAANAHESEGEILAYVREQLEVATRLRRILTEPPRDPQVPRQARAAERSVPRACGWSTIGLGAAGVFLFTAALAWITGVSPGEQRVFDVIVSPFDRHGAFFHWCTTLGSGPVVLVAGLFLLVLLPGPSLRRWWLWILVVVAVSVLEDWGKLLIGRPRPEAARAGFPSGHMALAAAFYPMVAYIAAHWMRHRWARLATYGVAGVVVVLIAVSRIVRWMHGPLDVVCGAALGVSVFAAAAWWYERYPTRRRLALASVMAALGRAVHRHERIIPIPFFALVFATPAMRLEHMVLDVPFDVVGAACILAALWLHLWAVEHATGDQPTGSPPATGPYRHIRHPRQVVYVLIGAGLAVLAESALGLIFIPAILIMVYRVVAHVEETRLAEQYGAAYAEQCARVPLVPWPTMGLWRDAASAHPWRVIPQERRFVLLTLVLAALADLSDLVPRWL